MFSTMISSALALMAILILPALASPTPNLNMDTTTAAGAHPETAAARDMRNGTAHTTMAGRFTYYDPGLGACGTTTGAGDLVAAVSHAIFDPQTPAGNPNRNPLCGRRIRASYGGQAVTVTMVDRCVGCGAGDLDLSPAAFGALANLNLGVVQGSWDWI